MKWNPAALSWYILQSSGNARPVPDDQIDADALQAWGRYCYDRGITIDAGDIPIPTTVLEALQMAAEAGNAQFIFREAKWSVVWALEPRLA